MTTQYASIFREDLFKGQTLLVTGGGTGIGRCIAHELARLGGRVIVAARREEPLKAVVDEITASGGEAYAVSLNIREEDAVSETVKTLIDTHGPIHGLVNNAGGQFASPAALIKPKGWRAVIDTNLNGTFFVSQAVFKHSMSRHGGSMVNIVADMWNGFPGMAHTGAARAGVVNLTKTLSIEWCSAGVRVNAVAPGLILSSGMNNYPPHILKAATQLFDEIPASRAGTESEVSGAVTYLLSPAANYVTGTTLRVDGGASLQKKTLIPLANHDRCAPFEGFHLEADLPALLRKGD